MVERCTSAAAPPYQKDPDVHTKDLAGTHFTMYQMVQIFKVNACSSLAIFLKLNLETC